jgi:histidine triad (HIT) family protein
LLVMGDCVFCKIAKDKSRKFHKETENFVVFESSEPKAPLHLLIVSKEHILDITEISDALWVEAKNIALELAKELNLKSFRVVSNALGATEVKHYHMHFLGNIVLEREV